LRQPCAFNHRTESLRFLHVAVASLGLGCGNDPVVPGSSTLEDETVDVHSLGEHLFCIIHFYLGVFFAPFIILFCGSGALQTFRLQETQKGSTYTPSLWIVMLADIHKDQELNMSRAGRGHRPLEWFV
jgi:hypothetical protein